MALDPQSKDSLMKFTMAAKKVIYNPERMKAFMQMLGSPDGDMEVRACCGVVLACGGFPHDVARKKDLLPHGIIASRQGVPA